MPKPRCRLRKRFPGISPPGCKYPEAGAASEEAEPGGGESLLRRANAFMKLREELAAAEAREKVEERMKALEKGAWKRAVRLEAELERMGWPPGRRGLGTKRPG